MSGVLCKLDLEKAYDHLNRDFLIYMLCFQRCAREMGLLLVYLLCFPVLVNVSLSGFFRCL